MKGVKRRNFKNGLKFERVKCDIVFGHNEAQKLAIRNAKDTLKGVELNAILVFMDIFGHWNPNHICP